MGELPTGGAAFIAGAAGGCWGGGGGRRHLACGHSGGGGSFVWHQRQGSGAASQPLSHKVSEGELGGGTLPKLRQLTLEIRQRSILVDSTASSLINQSCESPELRLRKKAGRCLVSEVPPPPVDKLRRLVTLPTRGGSFDLLANACPDCLRLSS